MPKEIRRTLRLREGTPLEIFTDRDQVIAVAGGPKKDILQKNISRQLEQLINERQSVCAGKDEKNFIPLVNEELESVTAQVVTAIICEGDAIKYRS